jgi:hypothetical protein
MLNFNAPSKALRRQSTAVLLSVAAVALAGLATPAQAGNYDAVLGAGVGAAAGAIIGQQVGGRQGAVIGGATGAVIGASMGNASNHGGVHSGGYGGGRAVEPVQVYYPPQRPARVIVVNDYRRPEPYGPSRGYYDRDFDNRNGRDFRRDERHFHHHGGEYNYNHERD